MKRLLWPRHFACGHIVATLADGSVLLCVRRWNHPANWRCWNPLIRRPA